MNQQELAAALIAAHDPSLLDREGHVCQVWEDGELTLQKSGSLLGQRTLHMIRGGKVGLVMDLPMKNHNASHCYVCVDMKVGEQLLDQWDRT